MKAEIIAKIEELEALETVMASVNEFNDLVTAFYKIQDEEERQWEIAKLERIEAGEKPESIEKPVFELLSEFKVVSAKFKAKKSAELTAKNELQKANFLKKKALIAALADLIQNEENIGRAIGRYRDIQDSWKEVGAIARDKQQEVQKEFSNLVDNFQFNINIYKDIKDHDLNRNLTIKKDLIVKLKALLEVKKIKDVETQLRSLQDEWTSTGGTHQKEWEEIKEEYWATVNSVYEKIRTFYDARREERSGNIDKKKLLIEKAKEINEEEVSEHKEWKSLTDKILNLQNEWKKIGFGDKTENDKVWEDFRGICNEFFDKKKAFYGERDSEFSGVKEKKEALILKAIEIKDSTDWKDGTQKIIALQRSWKELGSAGPKFENKLWKKFRTPIDGFFSAKDGHFEEMDEANKGNLEAKQALIKKVEDFKPSKDAKKDIDVLREFSTEFAAIGNVPFADKDNIYKAYKSALDAKYDALNMDKGEKETILFQAKLDSYKGSPNKDRLIDNERTYIRTQIDKLNLELNKYETNMSFFSNVDDKNPLFKSVIQNMDNTKTSIESLKSRLKMIREMANE